MESDEDEDVIFEGSQLYEHLKSSQYSGPDIEFYDSGKNSQPFSVEDANADSGSTWSTHLQTVRSKLGFPREDYEEQFGQEIMQSLLKSSLISLEDTDFLVNILDERISPLHLQTERTGSWYEILPIGGAMLAMLFLFSSRLPWTSRVPSYIFVGVNVLTAGREKFKEWTRRKFTRCVDQFQITLNQIQDLVSTMNKSTQFVQEMELIDRGFTLPNLMTHLSMKTLPNQSSALLCLPLREELLESVQELCEITRLFTLYTRQKVPLNSTVDNPSHYMACSVPALGVTDKQHVTLQAVRASLRQCHHQISEMLRRLALSFLVPVSQHHIDLVDTFNRSVSSKVIPLTRRLRTAYDYYTAWKVSDPPDILSMSVVSSEDDRPKGVDLALHSLERHLRATALIIESVRGKDLSAEMRIQLSHECKAVATCWELVQIEMGKLSNATANESIRRPTVDPPSRTLESNDSPIQPLYGAWEPNVEDLEILEADLRLADWSSQDAQDDDDDLLTLKRETREERLARKRELAAQSKRLYSELQVVLKSKAAEWKEREARVMERLGRAPATDENEHEPSSSSSVSSLADSKNQEDNDQDDTTSKGNQPDVRNGRDARIRFDPAVVPSSTFGIQASLAAQVRALASQRAVQNEDLIGDSDDAESTTPPDSSDDA